MDDEIIATVLENLVYLFIVCFTYDIVTQGPMFEVVSNIVCILYGEKKTERHPENLAYATRNVLEKLETTDEFSQIQYMDEHKENIPFLEDVLIAPEEDEDFSQVTGQESSPMQISEDEVNTRRDELELTEFSHLRYKDARNEYMSLLEDVLITPNQDDDFSPGTEHESSPMQIAEDEVKTDGDDLEPVEEELEVTWKELFQIQYVEEKEDNNILLDEGLMVSANLECMTKKPKQRRKKRVQQRLRKRWLKELHKRRPTEIREKATQEQVEGRISDLELTEAKEEPTEMNNICSKQAEQTQSVSDQKTNNLEAKRNVSPIEKVTMKTIIQYLGHSGATIEYLSFMVQLQQVLRDKEPDYLIMSFPWRETVRQQSERNVPKVTVKTVIQYLAHSGVKIEYLSFMIQLHQDLREKETEELVRKLSWRETVIQRKYNMKSREYPSFTIRALALRKFSMLLHSRVANEEFMFAVECSLPRDARHLFDKAYFHTKSLFEDHLLGLTEVEHDDFLECLSSMRALADSADVDMIEENMLSWRKTKVINVKRKSYKWGDETYHYDKVAY